jgi:hypothetical protein
MYVESIELLTAAINNNNQIEVLYNVIARNDGVEVARRREGMVWQPTQLAQMNADTISGNLPQVQTLAATFWTPAVVAAYQAAQAAAEAARNSA